MKPATWRALLLALCAITAIVGVAQLGGVIGIGGAQPWYGLWGSNAGASSEPFNVAIENLDPSGPSARAGLRIGDLVDIRANTAVERFEIFGQPLNGRAIVLSVRRGALQTRVRVVPGPVDLHQQRWAVVFLSPRIGVLWLVLFAALIVRRRASSPGNLLLSTVLVFIAIGSVAFNGNFAAPWAWVYVLFGIFYQALLLSLALWAAYASTFAAPPSRARRLAQWICYALVGATIAIDVAQIVGLLTLWFDPVVLSAPALTITIAAFVAAVVCSAFAVIVSRGIERQRAVWSLVPLALLSCAPQSEVFLPKTSISYDLAIFALGVAALVTFLTPVVLTYVALNRRLIDIGFVLNRAVIFAIVSAIVIGAFIAIEWAAGTWLTGMTHTSSTVIGLVVAMGIGLSMRYIHTNVDRFVDRVFFRKRHEDESALRAFAQEAAYITDRSVLLERAVREVREHTDARDASILVLEGSQYRLAAPIDGPRVAIGENDPAILALRAWRKPLDLHTRADSALQGELAFPMLSRGALVGVLICGPKVDGESYAPDESDALRALAHGVGTTLDMLSPRRDGAIESLAATQATIVTKLDALESQVRAALLGR